MGKYSQDLFRKPSQRPELRVEKRRNGSQRGLTLSQQKVILKVCFGIAFATMFCLLALYVMLWKPVYTRLPQAVQSVIAPK